MIHNNLIEGDFLKEIIYNILKKLKHVNLLLII